MKKEEKQNCWEFMQCGREPGGLRAQELGICPATTLDDFHNVNNGKKAGRFCWFISGTLCKGEVQGIFARKFANCLECSFYLMVEKEEGRDLILTANDL